MIQQGGSPLTGTTDLGLYSQNSGFWMRFVTNSAPFQWYTDGGIGTTPRMTLTTGGNLGIGVVSPGTKLDVAGTAKMTGFQMTPGAGANRVLTSDANGVGTWEAFAPGGAAGGDLTGAYPNPSLANNTVNAARLQSDPQSLFKVSAGLLTASTIAENIDQSQTSAGFGSGQTTGAQSFTPSVTGDLTALDIYVSSLGSQGATLRIYQGENLTGTGSPSSRRRLRYIAVRDSSSSFWTRQCI